MRLLPSLRQIGAGLRVMLLLTVVLGIVYPLFIWGISRIGTAAAEGSPLRDSAGCIVGSSLIGVDPQVAAGQPDPYFHLRSAGDNSQTDVTSGAMAPGNPAAADGNDLGPNNETQLAFVDARRAVIAAREGVDPSQVPADAVTSSGSGVDPQISPAYAALQVARVAKVNNLSVAQVQDQVAAHTDGRQLGFLGEERVNVPALNTALGLTAATCDTR